MDSSAFVKLPLREPEHEALRIELRRWQGYVSSSLLRVEAVRACARYGDEYADAARRGVEALVILPVDEVVLEHATRLRPRELRSLDAIHISTALSLEGDLGVMLSYDERLSEAARAHGVRVLSPA